MAIRYIEFGPGRHDRRSCEQSIIEDTGWTRDSAEALTHEIDSAIPLARALSLELNSKQISVAAATEVLRVHFPWMTPGAIETLRRYGDFVAAKA